MIDVVYPECLTRLIRWTVQEVAVQLFDESIAVIDSVRWRLNSVVRNRDDCRGWQCQRGAVARTGKRHGKRLGAFDVRVLSREHLERFVRTIARRKSDAAKRTREIATRGGERV